MAALYRTFRTSKDVFPASGGGACLSCPVLSGIGDWRVNIFYENKCVLSDVFIFAKLGCPFNAVSSQIF